MRRHIIYKILILSIMTMASVGVGYSLYGVKLKLFHSEIKIMDDGSFIMPQKYGLCAVNEDCVRVQMGCIPACGDTAINKIYQYTYFKTGR